MVDRQGCDPSTRFLVPSRNVHWVALLQRGNCTFREKILKAAAYNATGVLIYNNSTDKTVRMGHEGQKHVSQNQSEKVSVDSVRSLSGS